jgi:hypothetical protein
MLFVLFLPFPFFLLYCCPVPQAEQLPLANLPKSHVELGRAVTTVNWQSIEPEAVSLHGACLSVRGPSMRLPA